MKSLGKVVSEWRRNLLREKRVTRMSFQRFLNPAVNADPEVLAEGLRTGVFFTLSGDGSH